MPTWRTGSTRRTTLREASAQEMTQLRAGIRLCRLWRSQGRSDADQLLRGVYDTFTEGFGSADLAEARELLGSLPSGG